MTVHGFELPKVYETLREDVDALAEARRREGQQYAYPDPVHLGDQARRNLVRAIFAFAEGVTFQVKQCALGGEAARSFSEAEAALASDMTYGLADSGRVVPRPARIRFLPNLRFAIDLLARAEQVEWCIDTTSLGWKALTQAVRLRDRLMHPKTLSDLCVSDAEIRNALVAFVWLDGQIAGLIAACVLRLRETKASLQRTLEKRTSATMGGGQ